MRKHLYFLLAAEEVNSKHAKGRSFWEESPGRRGGADHWPQTGYSGKEKQCG